MLIQTVKQIYNLVLSVIQVGLDLFEVYFDWDFFGIDEKTGWFWVEFIQMYDFCVNYYVNDDDFSENLWTFY